MDPRRPIAPTAPAVLHPDRDQQLLIPGRMGARAALARAVISGGRDREDATHQGDAERRAVLGDTGVLRTHRSSLAKYPPR